MADDQDTLEEKSKQNEEAVKVSSSRNAVIGSEVDVDGESLHEFLDQHIAEENLDEWKKMENFHVYILRALKNLKKLE
jgi:hypothetical protein